MSEWFRRNVEQNKHLRGFKKFKNLYSHYEVEKFMIFMDEFENQKVEDYSPPLEGSLPRYNRQRRMVGEAQLLKPKQGVIPSKSHQ